MSEEHFMILVWCLSALCFVIVLCGAVVLVRDSKKPRRPCHKCGNWFHDSQLKEVRCGLSAGHFCRDCENSIRS